MHSSFYRTVARVASILLAFSLLFSPFSVRAAPSPIPTANRGPEMVKDINTMNMASGAQHFTGAGDAFYFQATDGLHGYELWRSEGTPETTFMLKDLYPGEEGSYPNHITRLDDDHVIFFANDSTNMAQIGVSDGTVDGTRMLTNLTNFAPFDSTDPVSLGSQVYLIESLSSLDGKSYLWRTDGTQANTSRIAEYSSSVSQLGTFGGRAAFDGWLYFTSEGPNGQELYRTNPSTNEVVPVSDLCASTDDCGNGLGNASPANLIAASDRLYFTAYDKDHGRAIWSTSGPAADGTEDITLVVDLIPGSGSQETYSNLTPVGDDLYFIGPDGANGTILWELEITTENPAGVLKKITGSAPLPPDSNFMRFTALGNTLFFEARSVAGPFSFYRTTGSGVELISSAPYLDSNPIQWGNALYFLGDKNGSYGIWSITENDAPQPKIEVPRFFFSEMILWKDHLIFDTGDMLHSYEPWISDGTQAGTAMLADLNMQAYKWGADIQDLPVIYQDAVYFQAQNGFDVGLWHTKGTALGTEKVGSILPGLGFNDPVVSNNLLYFIATDGTLWRSDGTEKGTYRAMNPSDMYSYGARSLVDINGTLFFISSNVGYTQTGLRVLKKGETNLTFISEKVAGAYQVGALGSNYITVGFATGSTPSQWQVVRSDGTAEGTEIIYQQNTTASTSQQGYLLYHLEHMVAFDGRLFFVAPALNATGSVGSTETIGLYATDGQTVKQITSSEGAPTFPNRPVVVGETLYFGAMNGTDSALWKLEKGAEQAQVVHTTAQGLSSYTADMIPVPLVDLNGKLVFSDGALGKFGLLWLSDGTASGTVPLCPSCGYQITSSEHPIVANGKLYFAAKNAQGNELWVSDGTDSRTRLLGDLQPGTASSNPGSFIVLGHWLLFTATDGTASGTGHGYELWHYDLNNNPYPSIYLPLVEQK